MAVLLEQLANPEAGDLSDVIDLDRYPIHEPGSMRWTDVLERAHRRLADDGCLVLDGFLRPAALKLAAEEIGAMAIHAPIRRHTSTVYARKDAEVALGADDPRTAPLTWHAGHVTRDMIPPYSIAHRLYASSFFKTFIAACTQRERVLFEYADPLAGLVATVLPPTGAYPWHYDTNEYVATIMTRKPDIGGVFQYCPNLRRPGDENLAGLSDVLSGQHPEMIRTVDVEPGDLQLFLGRYSLHQVTATGGDTDRHVMVFSYADRPGVIGPVDRTRSVYGRVTEAHLVAEAAAELGRWPDPVSGFTAVDDAALDRGRMHRLRRALADAGCDAGLFSDPINIRYATGTSNMQVYALHNACRYVFVPVSGPVVLFEFKGCEHLSVGHPMVDEVRPAVSWYHFVSGSRVDEFAKLWAEEISALLGPDARDLAVDRCDPVGASALERHNIRLHDGQQVANQARMIKTSEEVQLIREAIAGCEQGVADMRASMQPGMTEQELWSKLHAANIAAGGEWLETRLLTSGQRTNPWYQECSAKAIDAGDLVAFDTDLVGIGGYSVDISRTWTADAGSPTPNQQRLHAAALEQLEHNLELFRPGASFAEISHRGHLPPADIHSVTNAAIAHGIGLCNEYPLILNRDHFDDGGYDGEIEAGMVLCVEALAAPPGGSESVKLEEQILVTESGIERLSSCSLDLA